MHAWNRVNSNCSARNVESVRIASIVEGKGEVDAVPILLRRIAERVAPSSAVQVPRPIRVKRQQILKAGELERAVEIAARRTGVDGAILILLDADEDCPAHIDRTGQGTPVSRNMVTPMARKCEVSLPAGTRMQTRTPVPRRSSATQATQSWTDLRA